MAASIELAAMAVIEDDRINTRPGTLLRGATMVRTVIAWYGGWKAWEPCMLHLQIRPDGSVRTVVGTPGEATNMERLL